MADPSEYCTERDLYRVGGLQRGELANPGRLVGSVDSSVMTLDGHGFGNDDMLSFRAEAGGSLPAPLASGTIYYAIALTDATFQVAATAGGAAITLTTEGDRVVVWSPVDIVGAIRAESAVFDDAAQGAAAVPLEGAIPEIVKVVVARRSSALLLEQLGSGSAERIKAMRDYAEERYKEWRRGVSIGGVNKPASSNLAVTATATAIDSRGWEPEPGRIP